MEQYISEYISKYSIRYVKIPDIESIEIIYNLYKYNKLDPTIDYNDIVLLYIGIYYRYIKNNYELMKKYYLMAIEKGNISSMGNLANYYNHIEKNYELTKKYYLMAIEKGNISSMGNLAKYYQHIEKNHELMKKYYLMAIENGSKTSMNNLGYYYHHIKKNYELMKKYYLMAIEKNHDNSMYNLIRYYENNCINNQQINDAIEIFDKYNKTNYKYKFINLLYSGKYKINNYYMLTEYIFATNIQNIIIKFNHNIINHKNIFDNYKKIWLLLNLMKPFKISKYIKFHVIYFICT